MKIVVSPRGRGFKWAVLDNSGVKILQGRSRAKEIAQRRAEQALHMWDKQVWIDIGLNRSIRNYGGDVVGAVYWKTNGYLVANNKTGEQFASGRASKALCDRALRRCCKRGVV